LILNSSDKGVVKGDKKVNKKRREILGKICIAINSSNVNIISKLVEFAFNAGYTAEEIKKRVRICDKRHDFNVICEFCRILRFEESRRNEK